MDGGLRAGRHAAAHHRRLNGLVREAMTSEAYRTLTRTTYGVPFSGSPEELAAFQASETRKWGEIVELAGMKEP